MIVMGKIGILLGIIFSMYYVLIHNNQITDKIEGFFKVCKNKGLNKENGVLIPYQNVKNLTLSDEVIEAVREGTFHIYPISTIDEGIEILTGVKAGEMDENGNYEEGTINYLVSEKLKSYAEKSKHYN